MMDDKQPNVIYTVCTIENLGVHKLLYNWKQSDDITFTKGQISDNRRAQQNHRTPGFFLTLEEAKQCVEENWGDIHETGYEYVVIEKTPPGLYTGGFIEEEWWYRWEGDRDEGKYVETEKPECTKCIVGWGIG